MLVGVLAEGVSRGAAQPVAPQQSHQGVALAGRDAVAGERGGGPGGVGAGAQPQLQGGGQRAQRQLAGGGAAAGLQARGGGAERRVAAAAVAVGGRLAGHGGAGWGLAHQARLHRLGALTGA